MVTSSGTVDPESGTGGYELIFSGFPEDTEFFRVDTGEKEVTGPHVTGTEAVSYTHLPGRSGCADCKDQACGQL